MKKKILSFINQFNASTGREQIEECFTSGMCYWFAFLLANRFPGGEIVYAVVENHFAYKYDKYVYDITGDITNKYTFVSWFEYSMRDQDHASRIQRDCILKNKRKES